MASAYDIKAIKHKAYLTFSLQPKRNINVFVRLPINDKSWDKDLKHLHVVGGNWPSLTVNSKRFPGPRVFTKGKIYAPFVWLVIWLLFFYSKLFHLTRHSSPSLFYLWSFNFAWLRWLHQTQTSVQEKRFWSIEVDNLVRRSYECLGHSSSQL